MKRTLISTATLGFAALLLAGCSVTAAPDVAGNGAAGGEDSSTNTHTQQETGVAPSQVPELIADGTLPKGFPSDASDVRLVQDSDTLAAAWKGSAITGECTAAEARPDSFAGILLIQDAPISDVQQCDGFWQAKQADGSRLFWNTSAKN